jgi:AcrR family transcriptional regulator
MGTTVAVSRGLRKRERTRGEIVAAAERLVAARGLDALSIDEITEAADVAKGTFYTHFTDKDDLAAAIGRQIRLDLEDRITRMNAGVKDAGVRMANGLATVLDFSIRQPVRALALMRLIPGSVDPETQINAGIRADIVLGQKTKVFQVPSLNAAVVVTLGSAMSAAMRLAETHRPVDAPYDFAADVIAIALAGLGMKTAEAQRLARTTMDSRRKETTT